MEYELVFSTDAIIDIGEAIAWYEMQKEGLGLKFALSFKESVRFLEHNPLYMPKYWKR